MVVGEPSLMGGEFGDEDERLITRLENTQYDAANNLDPHSHDASGGPPPHPHQFHSEPTPGNSWPPDRGPGPPQGGPGSQVTPFFHTFFNLKNISLYSPNLFKCIKIFNKFQILLNQLN